VNFLAKLACDLFLEALKLCGRQFGWRRISSRASAKTRTIEGTSRSCTTDSTYALEPRDKSEHVRSHGSQIRMEALSSYRRASVAWSNGSSGTRSKGRGGGFVPKMVPSIVRRGPLKRSGLDYVGV